MRELCLEEIENVSGGMTENQCAAAFGIGFGLVGAAAASGATAGLGALGGFTAGAMIGGLFGGIVCAEILGL
jgi:hypothetical protein